MILTVNDYVNKIIKEWHSIVHYKCDYKNEIDTIESFIKKYGHMSVDINGHFISSTGESIDGTFIHKTS